MREKHWPIRCTRGKSSSAATLPSWATTPSSKNRPRRSSLPSRHFWRLTKFLVRLLFVRLSLDESCGTSIARNSISGRPRCDSQETQDQSPHSSRQGTASAYCAGPGATDKRYVHAG